MKILRKFLDKKQKGYYTLQPENDEDLWFLYNVIKTGDQIKLKIKRKIQETTMTGLTKTNKKHVWAKLEVLEVGFDYDNKGTSLFCKTKTIEGNEFLEVGQIQSIEIPLIYPITVYKSHWDNVSRGFIEESLKQNEKSDVGVLLIEDGLANAYYMKSNYSLWQGRVEKTMPRKKNTMMEFYKKAFNSFQERCFDLINNIFDLDTVKCFVIAGPGTSSKNFYNFLSQCKEKQENMKLKKNFSKFIAIQASSAQKSALMEIMEDETVQKNINDTRAQKETQILQKFLDMIRSDPLKAVYGEKETFLAQENLAIEHLLITDSLFRSHDFRARKKFIKLVDDAKRNGVKVHIFSDLHPSGQKLKEITGILRFELDLEKLEACHNNDGAITEYTEENTAKDDEEDKISDIIDDDQFETYLDNVGDDDI